MGLYRLFKRRLRQVTRLLLVIVFLRLPRASTSSASRSWPASVQSFVSQAHIRILSPIHASKYKEDSMIPVEVRCRGLTDDVGCTALVLSAPANTDRCDIGRGPRLGIRRRRETVVRHGDRPEGHAATGAGHCGEHEHPRGRDLGVRHGAWAQRGERSLRPFARSGGTSSGEASRPALLSCGGDARAWPECVCMARYHARCRRRAERAPRPSRGSCASPLMANQRHATR